METQDNFDFTPTNWEISESLIKVIGVGGGGVNAVTYMFNQKIQGCSFIVCNTDPQSLANSSVPTKISLGHLGAGCDPVKGRNAALEHQDEIIEKVLNNGTQMLFITAGMGGGTGTGASPVIAKMAKERGILTVAVVSLPFKNEGTEALSKAVDGIHELEKNVDSLLIINNEKLYTYFGNLLVHEAFPKADEVLATAVRGITEIISRTGYINVDFEDVRTMMKNSSMALMGCGKGTGENRLEDAVKGALESPLLNDFDLTTAKNLLVNVTTGKNERGLTMIELSKIDDLIKEYTGEANKFKRGIVYDDNPDFGDTVQITVIATGFKVSRLRDITDVNVGKLIIIGKDFVYDRNVRSQEEGGINLPDNDSYLSKVGFNSSENNRHFHYTEEKKPSLLVKFGQTFSDLEQTASIRRLSPTKSENA